MISAGAHHHVQVAGSSWGIIQIDDISLIWRARATAAALTCRSRAHRPKSFDLRPLPAGTCLLDEAAPLLLVGISSFIGEGFDCPALDTPFLAAPITFKNSLVQNVERLIRPHAATATVHDYHDELTPVLAALLRKRAPGYTKLGFPDPRRLVR